MNNFRLYHILSVGLLIACGLWLVVQLPHGGSCPPPVASASGALSSMTELPPSMFADSLPPVDVPSLPFVAQDNTCTSGLSADISSCTGMLSGGEAREYRIAVAKDNQTLRIEVEPLAEYFDVSLALFDRDGNCLAGADSVSAGKSERAMVAHLAAGEYKLTVGGYRDNCGPYLLTLREDLPPPVEVTDNAVKSGPNGTSIRWTTFAEVDFSYFGLYRVSDSGRERIAMLRAHGGPADFADYRYLDRNGQPDNRYELEAVAKDGRIETRPLAVG